MFGGVATCLNASIQGIFKPPLRGPQRLPDHVYAPFEAAAKASKLPVYHISDTIYHILHIRFEILDWDEIQRTEYQSHVRDSELNRDSQCSPERRGGRRALEKILNLKSMENRTGDDTHHVFSRAHSIWNFSALVPVPIKSGSHLVPDTISEGCIVPKLRVPNSELPVRGHR